MATGNLQGCGQAGGGDLSWAWTLIKAGAVRGRTVTSWPSLKTDLKNAGANWVDKEAVSDQSLVTSRKPDDIPAFNREMIRLFGKDTARRDRCERPRKRAGSRVLPNLGSFTRLEIMD